MDSRKSNAQYRNAFREAGWLRAASHATAEGGPPRKYPSASVSAEGPAIDLLRAKKMRITHARVCVLEAFENHARHFTAEELYEYVVQQGHRIGLASLYRILGELEQLQILRGNRLYHGKMSFELVSRSTPEGSRLICRQCNRIEKLDSTELDLGAGEMPGRHGFSSIEHSCVIYGICMECAAGSRR